MRCVIYLQWVSALHQASRVRHKQVARAHCSSCLWCAISCACDTRSRVASGLPPWSCLRGSQIVSFNAALFSCARLTISPKHISSRPALSSGMSPAIVQAPPCPRFASSWLHQRQMRCTRARVRARSILLRPERALFGRLGDPGDPKRVCALVLLIAADREKRRHCSKIRASELVRARSGEKQHCSVLWPTGTAGTGVR